MVLFVLCVHIPLRHLKSLPVRGSARLVPALGLDLIWKAESERTVGLFFQLPLGYFMTQGPKEGEKLRKEPGRQNMVSAARLVVTPFNLAVKSVGCWRC